MAKSVGTGFLQVLKRSDFQSSMLPEKAKTLKWFVKIFILALLIVFVVRIFFIQPFTVSSSQMETALVKGDRVVVSKLAYGVRLPMTILSSPFSFDVYSDAIQLGYNRLFASNAKRNDVVVFNSPLELGKPLDKRSLYVSRCVAVSGDSMQVDNENLYINGKEYIPSPNLLLPLRSKKEYADSVLRVLKEMSIPERNSSQDSLWIYLSLNRYEFFLVNENLSDSMKLEVDINQAVSYNLVVPAKGVTVLLNSQNTALYEQLIKQENENADVRIENSKIYLNNQELTSYSFKSDYYWFLSDNVEGATDSRTLGFISERNIIGKVLFIWSSYDNKEIRWSRFFKNVE